MAVPAVGQEHEVGIYRQAADGGYVIGDDDKHIMKLASERTRQPSPALGTYPKYITSCGRT